MRQYQQLPTPTGIGSIIAFVIFLSNSFGFIPVMLLIGISNKTDPATFLKYHCWRTRQTISNSTARKDERVELVVAHAGEVAQLAARDAGRLRRHPARTRIWVDLAAQMVHHPRLNQNPGPGTLAQPRRVRATEESGLPREPRNHPRNRSQRERHPRVWPCPSASSFPRDPSERAV